ncbi:MAG: GNAT family N-acetyltransferase [Clostridia bacterium]|nr:GNAT family N-acetyltransferase [Clostridia bacterium]MBQ8369098.1 GNAT family N-acetyltransferase [Clostridia bacterium]MBQ8513190.1 GNAT family N-acetyltransferase [Clostridia bacterium]
MKVFPLYENPDRLDVYIDYFQSKWATPDSMMVYADCLRHGKSPDRLPAWYLLMDSDTFDPGRIAGCAGLIPNDFISRMDLYPWLCALLVEPEYRGNNHGSLLIHRAIEDAARMGFDFIHCATDHCGYYEHFGFEFTGTGWHPWGETSRIYSRPTTL